MKLLKFTADWCHGCKTLTKQLTDNPIPNVEVEEIDIEKDENKAEEYKIKSLPTCILLDDSGKPLMRFSGFTASYNNMVKEIAKL